MRAARSSCLSCTRSALIPLQSLRPLSVPDFLAPALARQLFRPPSASRRADRVQAHHPELRRPGRPALPSTRIPLPTLTSRKDIGAWISALDPFLPPHLQQSPDPSSDTEQRTTAIDFACLLLDAQQASDDLLGYLGWVEQRWETTKWIIYKIADGGPPAMDHTAKLEPTANVIWPESTSLKDLTNAPIVAHRLRQSTPLRETLENSTSIPESIDHEKIAIQRAMGQVWRTLGVLIVRAAEDSTAEAAIMSHVLEIIAYLHHTGWIPDSVYYDSPAPQDHALQQPPTLHLLSSTIMRALSDAAMTAREATVKDPREKLNASYFLGREIPGSRYKVHVSGLTPELWLELLLWSCVHGPWVLDGTAILEHILSKQGNEAWRVMDSRQLYHDEETAPATSSPSSGWRIFGRGAGNNSNPGALARTRKTISSEAVTAYIDGLVNLMRLGVGDRGTSPEDLVDHIRKLKGLLDRDGHSLGSATWDSIIVRFLESGGVVPEKRPEVMFALANLAADFGTEVASVNAVPIPGSHGKAPYYFEPSTISISVLHRTMRSFIENGDITGATKTLDRLVQHTDCNKQRSLEQFFEAIKVVKRQRDGLFTSLAPPIDFPAFEPQVPVPLLAKLLDLATVTKSFHLGRWLLMSEDLDGPLITADMYAHPDMAASIVHFGTMAGENDLVMKVLKRTGFWSGSQQAHRIPNRLLTTLLQSQVQLHRWEKVRSMRDFVASNPAYRPRTSVLATFAAELVRLSPEEVALEDSLKRQACEAFADLLFAWEELLLTHSSDDLYCILAMLSTVDDQWREYCVQFLQGARKHEVKLSTADFNTLLAGVLDGYDSVRGKSLVDTWCHTMSQGQSPNRAPGGIPKMPRFRKSRADDLENRPEDIQVGDGSGAELVMQGRVHANRQTIWAILMTLSDNWAALVTCLPNCFVDRQ
ncbi:uncharacterized protein EI97DRAFT_495597 [Westerdykella ornata]|uniref:Uncharacterized protein n=1 Tax=Westerdykella ornata TaxID=318751 RepID=A0A6A6JDS5_WESOR|nr:uncharacterized protein EI97DRAFT_495597 [Westerdykella ornata]KAF2274148.1 hypothetical protein EI97DRAFT_495597 [Westerdykella ornata]